MALRGVSEALWKTVRAGEEPVQVPTGRKETLPTATLPRSGLRVAPGLGAHGVGVQGGSAAFREDHARRQLSLSQAGMAQEMCWRQACIA